MFVVYTSFTILTPSLDLFPACVMMYAEKEEGEERGNKATLTFDVLTCGLFHLNCLLRRVLPNNYYLTTIHSQTAMY